MLSPNIQFQLLHHHLDNGMLCLAELLVTFVNVLVCFSKCEGEFSDASFRSVNEMLVIANLFVFCANFVPKIMHTPSEIDRSQVIDTNPVGARKGRLLGS
jgi:hypothetical protein